MKTIDHIALLVDDLEESQKWYEDNLDAVCVFNDKFYKRMKVSNTTIALICKNRYEYNHVAILVDNVEELPKDGKRVAHRDGTIGVYTFDNSGHCVEFIYYSPEIKKKLDL
tara:strand:+ start:137 stop:469 length:333 start_codon:yes stop_codon:yes gene_type:complete